MKIETNEPERGSQVEQKCGHNFFNVRLLKVVARDGNASRGMMQNGNDTAINVDDAVMMKSSNETPAEDPATSGWLRRSKFGHFCQRF